MRVALIRLAATPLVVQGCGTGFGGAEVRALAFARGLANSTSHDVRLVVNSHADLTSEATHAEAGSRLRIQAVPPFSKHALAPRFVQKMGGSLRRRLRLRPNADRRFRITDVDCFVAFGVQTPTPSIVRTARALGKPVVVSLTSDDDARDALDDAKLRGKRGRMLRDYRYALLASDTVLVQTTTQQHLVEDSGQRAILIRNPIDVARVALPSPTCEFGTGYVLWVGRADTNSKRADLAFEVARRCPDVQFVMVMNPIQADMTRGLLNSEPPNVRVIERVDWASSDALYAHAVALLNTSESEGFPNAFLQAGKFGVPIVSRRVNPDGVLTRFRSGFVANDDLDELAAMTTRIACDPQRFAQLGRANRQYVVDFHEAGARFREFDACLNRLATDVGARRAAA